MLGLFFGGKRFKSHFGSSYGNIELDATLTEAHNWSAEVTSYPVEEGSPVTDHVIEQSDRISINGLVTDAPINFLPSFATFNSNTSKCQTTFDLLHKLLKLKLEMTVYTKYKVYTDMVMNDVFIPRTAENGESIEFVANFIKIRKVSTQLVKVPEGIAPDIKDIQGGTSENTVKAKDPLTGKTTTDDAPSVSKKASPQQVTGKVQTQTVKPSVVDKVEQRDESSAHAIRRIISNL